MAGYTVLVCPTCGGKTSVREDTALADCMYCGNQIILRPAEIYSGGQVAPPVAHGAPRERPLTPMPAGMHLVQDGEGLTITRRWYAPKYIFLAFFCLIWDGFLILWFSLTSFYNASWIFILFPMLHVAVGVYLTYTTLAGFLNTSTVRLTADSFSVTHAPLPWPGAVHLHPAAIEQLYTREVNRRTKNGVSTTYTLSAVFGNGRKQDLLSGVEAPEACLFIEQQVEDWLRIPNRAVAGELPQR